MRVLVKGTEDQIKSACAVISKPSARDRSELKRRRLADKERNKAESELMRKAFHLVRNDPQQRGLTNRLAKAIYGERSTELVLAAERIVVDSEKR